MQHVRPSPKAPSRSAPAKPDGLTFRWERFTAISRELPPLFKAHWREIALDQDTVDLDPDWDAYFELDLRGILHVLTARPSPGPAVALNSGRARTPVTLPPLVGYIFNLVGSHNHYASTRFAHTEMFWLHPAYRKGWQPVRFFLENLAGLRAREAEVATINFKLHFKDARVGRLLARLGYEATDIVMRKAL